MVDHSSQQMVIDNGIQPMVVDHSSPPDIWRVVVSKVERQWLAPKHTVHSCFTCIYIDLDIYVFLFLVFFVGAVSFV